MSYTIQQNKLEEITRIYNQQVDPKATEDTVQAEICADWNEGDEHQEWIDTASVQTIVNWLASLTA